MRQRSAIIGPFNRIFATSMRRVPLPSLQSFRWSNSFGIEYEGGGCIRATVRHRAVTFGPEMEETMLIRATGKCDVCGAKFGGFDTVQSVRVTCDSCGKHHDCCGECKSKGCSCGGKLLDAWESFEKKNLGNPIMF